MTVLMQVIIFCAVFLGCMALGLIIATYEKKG